MSDNILQPLFNAVWDCGIMIYKLLTKTEKKFDFEDFFKVCLLKNSREEYPKLYKEFDYDNGKKYLFTIPQGLSLKDFRKYQEALEEQLKVNIEINYKNGFIEITTIEEDLPTLIPYQKPILPPIKNGISIPIGITSTGPIYLNFKEHPHSFVVGSTGGGKSVCLKALMVSIITNYKPNDLEVYLGDLKYVEFALIKNASIISKFVTSVEDVTTMIQDLLYETERRYQLFESVGVTNIFDYNKKFPTKKLKFQLLIIEEIVNLLQSKTRKAMKLLKRLISISRSSGLYCIFSTQRPSADVIDAVVRANISNRIVFHTESEKDSIICLDEPGAEKLNIKGRGILKIGSNRQVFQGFYISDEEVTEYIKPYLKKKNEEGNNKNKYDKLIKKESTADDLTDLSFLDKI